MDVKTMPFKGPDLNLLVVLDWPDKRRHRWQLSVTQPDSRAAASAWLRPCRSSDQVEDGPTVRRQQTRRPLAHADDAWRSRSSGSPAANRFREALARQVAARRHANGAMVALANRNRLVNAFECCQSTGLSVKAPREREGGRARMALLRTNCLRFGSLEPLA